MNQEISRRISFLGFVMTCGIVFYHCGPSPAVPSVGLDQICFDAISNFFTNTATLAMSYFFAVTGYLLFLNLSLRGWAGKVKRRTFSLLVPYLAWQCLTFAVNLLHHEAMTKREFLKTTFLLDQWRRMAHCGIFMRFFCWHCLPLLFCLFTSVQVVVVAFALRSRQFCFSTGCNPQILPRLSANMAMSIIFCGICRPIFWALTSDFIAHRHRR